MNTHYTTDRSTQMVLSVLKAYGIKKIVVSPNDKHGIRGQCAKRPVFRNVFLGR